MIGLENIFSNYFYISIWRTKLLKSIAVKNSIGHPGVVEISSRESNQGKKCENNQKLFTFIFPGFQ